VKSLFAILLILSPCAVIAAPSVVLGEASGNFAIDAEVYCPGGEKDGLIEVCMDVWIGWRITVQKTLSGTPVRGRIRAARIQHGPFVRSYLKRFRLFVLEPIESAEMRKRLGADYLINDLSTMHEMYCISEPPAQYGLSEDDIDVHVRQSPVLGSSYCFELPKGGE